MLSPCEENEQHAEQNVSQIRKHVIEIGEHTNRMGAQEVVIAQILISWIVQHLNFAIGFRMYISTLNRQIDTHPLVCDNQLDDG